jgi:hypothetical protein
VIDVKNNVPFPISQRFVDGAGNPATGKAPTVTIYQQTRGGGGTVTVSKIVNSAVMTELDPATPSGVYYYSWTPSAVGYYYINIDETTLPARFFDEILVGNNDDLDLSTHLMTLANEGQPVTLGAGAGQITFTDTLMEGATPVSSSTVRAFNAFTVIDGSSNKFTRVDYTTVVAQALTSSTGSFTMSLNPGYYLLQTVDQNGALATFYMNVVDATHITLQQTPINP